MAKRTKEVPIVNRCACGCSCDSVCAHASGSACHQPTKLLSSAEVNDTQDCCEYYEFHLGPHPSNHRPLHGACFDV